MKNNYIEPMVVDAKGNIYISMEQYHKDIDRIKKSLQEVRKRLLHSKNTMKKLYKKRKDDIEGIKALGYVECIEYLDKYLIELLRSSYGEEAVKDN